MSLVGGYPSGAHYYGGTAALHSHDFYQSSVSTSNMGVGRYQWSTPHPGGNPHQMDLSPQDLQPWMSHTTHSTAPPPSGLIPQGTAVEHLGFPGSGSNGVENYPQGYGLTAAGYGHPSVHMYNMMGEEVGKVRCTKRKVSANKKERRRTISINTAFSALRGCIPNVPTDTKLSKIKTLRLATSYIAYLMDVLNKDDPTLTERGFKAEVPKKTETAEERRLAQEKVGLFVESMVSNVHYSVSILVL